MHNNVTITYLVTINTNCKWGHNPNKICAIIRG